ncbi:hypothetical protein [Sediminibacillus albus]|uniref:SPOR domain-containing protein n=1 Tax=Sediminibacillus albus TaxID=407036 RepID=A0A1G9BN42_9BACI|nr:hypothetical protein [Sediminibacillus albus]SDK40877.1 hypothetical protein SAMN05216243_3036 [Sediminibacillus albus]
MEKHKSITIRMKDKKDSATSRKAEHPPVHTTTYKQQAAALEKEVEHKGFSVLEQEDGWKAEEWSPGGSKRRKAVPRIYKVFVFAAIAALMIGLALGFIMLRMFAGMDENGNDSTANGNNQPVDAPTADGADEQPKQADFSVEGMNAYVVQGGVFSSQAKAEEWQKNFSDSGLPSVVWEHEGQFYLFAGLGDTEAGAKKTAELIAGKQLDTYVKAWQTEGQTKDLSDEEANWLQGFQALWDSSVSSQGDLAKDQWKEWLDAYPDGSQEMLTELHGQAGELLDNIGDMKPIDVQVQLLKMWKTVSGSK